jgi:hypothetical protein
MKAEDFLGIEPQEDTRPEIQSGFLQNLIDDLGKRGSNISESLAAQEQYYPETAAQVVGEVIGGYGDVLGNLASSAYGFLPENTRRGAEDIGRRALGAIGSLPANVGQETMADFVPRVLGGLAQDVAQAAGANPRAARNLRAWTNISTVATPALRTGLSQALKKSGKELKAEVRKLIPDANKITVQDLSTEASKAYDVVESAGGKIKKDAVVDFVDDIDVKVRKDLPEFELAAGGESYPIVKRFLDEDLINIEESDFTLQTFRDIDRQLGDLIDQTVQPTGSLNAEGNMLSKIQRDMRNFVEKLPAEKIEGGEAGFEALKRARDLWSRQAKLRDLEKIIYRAELTQNPNAIKTGLTTLLTNAKKTRGFTPDEIKMLEKAQKAGTIDAMRAGITSFLPAAFGTAINPAAGIAGRVGVQAARDLVPSGQLGRLEKAAQTIARGGVAQQAMPLPFRIQDMAGSGLGQLGSTVDMLERMRAPQALFLGLTNEEKFRDENN